MEKGESDLDALRRELKEELGIEIRDAELTSEYEYAYADGPRVSLCFYDVKSFEGAAKNLVFQQMSWVKVMDLGSLDFLEGDRRLIEQLLASDGGLLPRQNSGSRGYCHERHRRQRRPFDRN